MRQLRRDRLRSRRPPSTIIPNKEKLMPNAHRIAPCLWFDNQAEETANFYAMKKIDIAALERAAAG
jgi:hypothetical protein